MPRETSLSAGPVDPSPIAEVVDDIDHALGEFGAVAVAAATGSGKTTVLPLALLGAAWRAPGQRMLLLEPRRVAARAAARRLAQQLGERVGQTVGVTTSDGREVGPSTEIEVVTEGVLTRRLQRDPELADVAVVLFDEFHERSLHAELGLAFCLDVRTALRPDLRLAVLSATLDSDAVAELVGGPTVQTEGRRFPVDVRYLPGAGRDDLERATAAAVRSALRSHRGDVLVFLPGEREIRRTEELLRDEVTGTGDVLAPLYGALEPTAQDRAIVADPAGRRKVILATNLAETSLTIEGVRVVIDSGFVRRNRFDLASGMDRLETERISAASAAQRAGRAGRTAPGTAYRLWDAAERLERFEPSEISRADLTGLVLEATVWGAGDLAQLAWLDLPPAQSVAAAREALRQLGALDRADRLTPHGRRLAEFGAHPRLANLMVRHRDAGVDASTAALVAAVLAAGDPLSGPVGSRQSDLGLRIDSLLGDAPPPGLTLRRGAARQVQRQAHRWARRLGGDGEARRGGDLGALLALAHPDRVARARSGGGGRFVMVNGRGAGLSTGDPLSRSGLLAIAEIGGVADGGRGVGGGGVDGRIRLASPLEEDTVERLFADRIGEQDIVEWDDRRSEVRAVSERRLGAVVLRRRPLGHVEDGERIAAILDGVRRRGIAALPWTQAQRTLRARVGLVNRVLGSPWPPVDDEALAAQVEDWLGPFLGGARRWSDLERVDLTSALWTLVGWERRSELDRLAPERLEIVNGSRVTLRYEGDAVVLAVRLQHLFGAAQTPTVVEGRVPVTVHLLSPAGRPVQITQDLAGFWAGSYRAVRAEMRGRYPKHPWPEDPATAPPVAHNRIR